MNTDLRCLVVRPPWAWAIGWGTPWKNVDNRARGTNYRGDVIIQAAKAVDSEVEHYLPTSPRYQQIELVARSKMAAGEDYGACVRAWEARGAAICVVSLTDSHHEEPGCCESPWAERERGWPWHLCFENLRHLNPILPATGRLGVYRPDPDLADAVLAQLGAS